MAANYRLDALGWLALPELQAESPDRSYGEDSFEANSDLLSCIYSYPAAATMPAFKVKQHSKAHHSEQSDNQHCHYLVSNSSDRSVFN